MSGLNDVGLLVDPQASKIGLPSASEVVGSGSIAAVRTAFALTVNGYETAGIAVFGGEYISDNGGGSLADGDGFMLGFPAIMVNRML